MKMALQAKATVDLPDSNQAMHVPAGTGTAYWGAGELMTFLITSEESGGALFMSEISVAPGGGTAPHIHHHEDEAFRLLEGSLTLLVGGDTITASAGAFAFLPRGLVHSFKNAGDCDARGGPQVRTGASSTCITSSIGFQDFPTRRHSMH